MSSANGVVISLADPDAADPNRAGGKGANLAALVRDGLPVPAGFVVSTAGYRDFVREHNLDVLIRREMAQLDGRSDGVDATSERLRRAFEGAPIPAWLRDEITAAYSALGEGPVAVRSSATAEDLPGASFAGQQDTVLNVVGAADLCAAVRRCWSSVWTARAISYRQHNEIVHERVAVAVVAQRMVPADVAGVLFSADPVSGRRDHTVIEAAAGLGDAVVSGRVTPDRWTVERRTRAVLSGPGGARPSLTRDQLDALVGLGSRAADLFGVPQDIEWAVSDGRCWLLQSRPITSLFPLPPTSEHPGLRVYIPTMLVAQGIVEPMTPAGNVFFRAMSAAWMRYLLTGSLREDGAVPPAWLPVVAGRIYLDTTPLLQHPRLAAKLVSGIRMKDPTASAVLTDWLARNRGRLPRKRGWSVMRGLAAVVPSVMLGLIAAFVDPTRTRRRLLTDADERLARLESQATALTSPLAQIEFVDRILPAQTCELIVDQLSVVYAEELTKIVVERLLERWLGSASDFEPVRRWLPHDPTIAMGAELARLARDHAAAGKEPSAAGPEVAAFLAAYGHRAPDREIDLGLPRLADDPTYVVELIRGYMESGGPGQTVGRFETGAAQALVAVDNLVAKVRRAKGRGHAAVLRALLGRYRELGGFRERPKFDMVRAIALGRRTLRRAGATLVAQGLLDDAEQVFFLDTADVRAAPTGAHRDLRALATTNQREFDRELGRRAVPRILVSDGEAV